MARYGGYQTSNHRQPYVNNQQRHHSKHKHGGQGLSYSQAKREKLDYRRAYFAHNPGLFGLIWKCAYCQHPIFGKGNVEVDHIIPLNSVFGRNARYNLVSACQRCNREKSDKADGRIVVGYVSKIIDTGAYSVQKLGIIGIGVVWTAVVVAASYAFRLLLLPLKSKSLVVKLVAVVVYGSVIWSWLT